MSKAEPKCINRRHVVGGGSGLLIASLLGAPAARAEGTVRIGSLNSVTGAAGAFGSGVQKMVLQMVKEINAAGRPACRSRCSPRTARPCRSRRCSRRRS